MNVEGVPYYRSEQETIEYLRGHDAAIVSFEPINERTLGALPLTVTKLTRDLCDAATAKLRHCVLINTARGRIVDETALKEALNFLPEPGIYRFEDR